ncbi:MAG: UDP-N-acetylglucosamine--N-acetylmuramyl-(pentapeptide) pyrophosphoryl-undecaprenol N-acetylglucosamine transferase [Myxococcota bacterium]
MARVVLAGGGTGGHVYPALAVADALLEAGHEVIYYGDPGRLEGRVVPERGLPFRAVHAPQYPRGGVGKKLVFAARLVQSILRTLRQLWSEEADVVLGVGGYISAPTLIAAWLLRRPVALHEANVVPGMANKLCARFSDHNLLTFEATAARLPGGAPSSVVGVAVNRRIFEGTRAEAAKRYGLAAETPTVLFVGGSLGAAKLNDLALALAKHPSRTAQIVHLTGRRYHGALLEQLGEVPDGVALVDYEDQMGMAYALADLVVARAGSATLAELTALGKPSVLIPSPNVTENHQEGNARGLEAQGAAEVVVEADWDEAAVVERLIALTADRGALSAMADRARAMARPDAAEAAAAVVLSLT